MINVYDSSVNIGSLTHCLQYTAQVQYKRYAIIGELHRAKKIASNFDIEIKGTVNKYTATGFRSRFVRSIMYKFDGGKDNLIVTQWLFEERKAFTIHLLFSLCNENFLKTFISKLNYFTNENASSMLFGTQGNCSRCFH